jgi:MFS family permease
MTVPSLAEGTERTTPLPGARLALGLLLVINLFNYIDRYVLAAVVPALEDEFFPKDSITGLRPPGTEELIGALGTAFMVAYMLVSPVFGVLADRMSRWLLIGIGVILWSLASGASGLAATYLILLATRCFVGVGEAVYGPVAPTVISDMYPVKVRGYVLSWFYMAIPVGSALGYVLGGLVFQITGDWRWAFYIVVPPGILLGICCFFMPEPGRGQADVGSDVKHKLRLADLPVLLHTPSYVLNTLGMTAMTFAIGGIAYWMPRYITTDRGYGDLGQVNMIFGLIVVVSGLSATLLGGLAGDKLRDRYPGSYFLVSGVAMLAAFPMVLLVLVTPFPAAWIFLFLACFCLFFNTGPTNTILANVTHPAMRASGFAINIFVIHALGDAISPWIIGAIAGRSSMNLAFTVVSVMILVGGVIWLYGARYLAEDTARAPTRIG